MSYFARLQYLQQQDNHGISGYMSVYTSAPCAHQSIGKWQVRGASVTIAQNCVRLVTMDKNEIFMKQDQLKIFVANLDFLKRVFDPKINCHVCHICTIV